MAYAIMIVTPLIFLLRLPKKGAVAPTGQPAMAAAEH
jgi:hypothetical protein